MLTTAKLILLKNFRDMGYTRRACGESGDVR